jgi:hypothetical protein
MNIRFAVSLMLAAAMLVPGHATAQAPKVEAMKAKAIDVSVTGTITAINAADRTVTVKGPKGRSHTFIAGPEVKNFGSMKVGDEVDVDYQAAVAIALAKGSVGREKVETEVKERAPAGASPGMAAARVTTIVAKVENVDRKRSTATLQGPEGRYVVVKVKDPKIMAEVKAGDEVYIAFYEAAAVAVRPAKAKAK